MFTAPRKTTLRLFPHAGRRPVGVRGSLNTWRLSGLSLLEPRHHDLRRPIAECQTKLAHKLPLGSNLTKLLVPLLALPGVLGGKRRGERRELCLDGVGFLDRVDAVVSGPNPCPVPLGSRRQVGRDHAGNEQSLVEPRAEDAVQPRPLKLVAVDADVLIVQRAVEASRGKVVRRRVESGLVIRQIHAAGDLTENRSREGLVRVCRLLGLELRNVPALGKRGKRPLLDLDRGERVNVVDRRGRGVGVNERGQIGSDLRSPDHGFGVPPHVRRQTQAGRQLRDSAVLAGARRAKPVQHVFGRHPVVLVDADQVVGAGVRLENVVADHVAVPVHLDPVHERPVRGNGLLVVVGRRGDLIGLDEPDVELHAAVWQPRIRKQQAERLAVEKLRLGGDAELVRQADVPRPVVPRPTNRTIRGSVARREQHPRPDADQIVALGHTDAVNVCVVRPLVPGSIADNPPDFRRKSGVGRERIGVCPMAGIVARLCRVEPGADRLRLGESHLPGRAGSGRLAARSRLGCGSLCHVKSSPGG